MFPYFVIVQLKRERVRNLSKILISLCQIFSVLLLQTTQLFITLHSCFSYTVYTTVSYTLYSCVSQTTQLLIAGPYVLQLAQALSKFHFLNISSALFIKKRLRTKKKVLAYFRRPVSYCRLCNYNDNSSLNSRLQN